jgi:tetratricopeptide (TPR) repeat protein
MPFFLHITIMKKITTDSVINQLFQKAEYLYKTNQLIDAKYFYLKLLKKLPKEPSVLTNLGSIELQLGNYVDGILYLEKSINIDPDQIYAINNLANGYCEVKRFDEALIKIKSIEHLDAEDIYYNKGRILTALNFFDEANYAYDCVLKKNPNHISAIMNQGLIFHLVGQYKKALIAYAKVLKINPEIPEAFYNSGITYVELKKYDQAVDVYKKAIKINPNYAEAYSNLSITYQLIGDLNKAFETIEKLINIKPNYAEAHFSKGVICEAMKEHNEASNSYKKAIKINPDYPEANMNLALMKLNLKYFDEGWELFEKRFLFDTYKIKDINFKKNSTDLISIQISNSVLILNEQGIGDQILYLSMLPSLAKYSKKIDVLLDPRLIKLFKEAFPLINFYSINDSINLSNYDTVIPAANLGKIFRKSEKDFLGVEKYFLKADKIQSNFIKNNYQDNKKLCGISWKSKNEKIGLNKSISLETLLPILKLPHINFVSLQYGDTKEEIEMFNKKYGIHIRMIDEIDNFNDIYSLASLIDACDFVVTTSNVTVHLAGSLGKETYLMIPFAQGRIWYWHEDDKQSIWYPSVHIYRQPNLDNWSQPINEIAGILENSN